MADVAAFEVIVDEAHGLHEGVDGGGSDEAPAAFLEVFGKSFGFFGGGLFQEPLPGDGGWAVGGLVAPDVVGEGAAFGGEIGGALGVVDGGFDFAAVADDGGVVEEAGYVPGGEAGDFGVIELAEGAAETFALVEDGEPTEAGLKAFEAELFKEAVIVVDGESPFGVVVEAVEGSGLAPPAAGLVVFGEEEAVHKEDGSVLTSAGHRGADDEMGLVDFAARGERGSVFHAFEEEFGGAASEEVFGLIDGGERNLEVFGVGEVVEAD